MADSRELQLLLTVNDKMSQALNRIGNNTQNLTTRTSRLDGAVRGLVGAYVGVQGLRYAVDSTIGAAVRWEDAFAGVRKTVDATEEEFTKINESLREMATRIPVSATELANIGEVAGQLGVDAQNITDFTETVAKLGVATTLTSEEAANNLARIANIMQVPLDQVGQMGSALVDLGNNFATTEREINDFALRIAGAGNIAGLTTQDILGIGAAMSSVGVQAEAGGTAVQKVLLSINEAVQTGGDKLNTFSKTAGMSAAQFQTAWKENAGQAFTDFVEGLGEKGDEAIFVLQDLGLEDQRLIRSFLSLANAGDILEQAISRSNTAFEENTALNAEAEKRFATTASQIQLFRNNMDELGIVIGDTFLPMTGKALPLLIDFAKGFRDANKNIKDTFSSWGSFVETAKQFPSAVADTLADIGDVINETPLLGLLDDIPGLKQIGEAGANTINILGGGKVLGPTSVLDPRTTEILNSRESVGNSGSNKNYNFTFNGDVNDKDKLINLIKNSLNRDSQLSGAGI